MWSEIKIAFLCTIENQRDIQSIFNELRSPAKTKDAPDYYPDYPGFENVFRVPLAAAAQGVNRILPGELGELAYEGKHLELGRKLAELLVQMKSQRSNFDVVMILLPDEWADCFNVEDSIYTII